MDELDLLKKHWKRDAVKEKQLTSNDIYPMLLKKSSSIVKTLFYISIAELIFWIAINYVPKLSASYRAKEAAANLDETLVTSLTIFSYAIILVFIYFLYKSYKNISVTDNAKKLMESIISTRKVIKYYVGYNLIMAFVTMVIVSYHATNTDTEIRDSLTKLDIGGKIGLVIGFLIVTLVFVGVIWLFYKLIYGILMKRLNRNYSELKKLEI